MSQKDNIFCFEIENNNLEENDQSANENSGVGLENIKKNLEIVYPNNHTFITDNTNNVFTVKLSINTQ